MPYGSWILCFLALEHCWSSATGVKWLALAKMNALGTISQEVDCDKLAGLVKRQKQICRRNTDLMWSVQTGADTAISECQNQFKARRWNCSTVDTDSVFGSALDQGTREAAFVHSISSAGVAYSVTRMCSSGKLSRCGCDRSVRGKSPQGFQWAGCSDNVNYGIAFSKAFVDARERARGRKSGRALMNLHNNQAGRIAVEAGMRVQCKCHGVSGSCEMKTCWRAMPTFTKVGLNLKEKFDGATEVQEQRIGTRRQLVPVNAQYKPHTDRDLVYLVASPDFCEPDEKTGSKGTMGRACNKTSKAIDGCELMCCGRGFRTRKKIVVERCQCKFHWCCYVKCKECRYEVEEHTCL